MPRLPARVVAVPTRTGSLGFQKKLPVLVGTATWKYSRSLYPWHVLY